VPAMKPRILHLGKYFPPHMGGMETHLQELIDGTIDRYDIEALVANDSAARQIDYVGGARITRMPTLGTVASMPITPTLPFDLSRSAADLVHVHSPNPAAAFAIAITGYRGPLIVTHHSDILGRRHLYRAVAPFVGTMMQRADAIIATSQRYLESSEELRPYSDKCRVIPLGIGQHAFEAAPSLEEVQGIRNIFGSRLVLAVGRLVEYKGFAYLIRAMEHLDATCAIIGSGPQVSSLSSLVSQLNLRDKVHLVGHVPDLAPYLAAAQMLVMPSVTRAEAFGMVQLEAMAAALPVINTDIPSAVPEVSVHGETGLTVQPGDPVALAGAIQALLENDELRMQMGTAARKRAQTYFGADTINKRVAELYEAVLRPRSKIRD
jgi:glycosyltransferase involved in cell wall biosynthesis